MSSKFPEVTQLESGTTITLEADMAMQHVECIMVGVHSEAQAICR